MDLITLQKNIDELKKRLDQLSSSSDIPRNVETAFKERLGLSVSSTSTIISGVVTTDNSGAATITDSRIKSTSSITVTPQQMSSGTAHEYSAGCSTGSANISSYGAEYQSCPFNYVIIP